MHIHMCMCMCMCIHTHTHTHIHISGRNQAVFEIVSQFWASKNWRPNFDETAKKYKKIKPPFDKTESMHFKLLLNFRKKHFIFSFVDNHKLNSLNFLYLIFLICILGCCLLLFLFSFL